jgi:hypothetical protein
MIGADFDKIQFVLFGLNLVEPMAFITDTLMASLSIYLAISVGRFKSNHPFYTYWRWFFIIFGYGAFVGGLGHVFLNYWGVVGKFPSWICGPISIYCLEQGMIAIHPNEKKLNLFKLLSSLKLILVYGIFVYICATQPIAERLDLPFLPIAINTIVGTILTAGLLGLYYSKVMTRKFKYFYLGVLVMLPSAFIFLMKINLHQWFDKNDLSHVLMSVGIIYFYLGVKHNAKDLKNIARL